MSVAAAPADGRLIAYYGDDFTGSAAVAEVLEEAGVPTALFLDLPDADALARFPQARAIGIAGDARTRSPAWMDTHLPEIFAALRATGASIVHHKVCSTMDSAPQIGSIGRAVEIGLAGAGQGAIAPLVFAAPAIRRWQAFGTLFAAAPGGVARLDRHPSLRAHPVTPMDEADVRLHLARQTGLRVGLVDLLDLKRGNAVAATRREVAAGARIVAYDVVDEETLRAVGDALLALAEDGPLFVVGSQGVEYALAAARFGRGRRAPERRRAGPVARVAIVSGSCSPDTARQIAAAEAHGFSAIPLDATAAAEEAAFAREQARVLDAALSALERGESVVVYTARGPDDPAIARAAAARARAGLSAEDANRRLAQGLGELLAAIEGRAAVPRLAIAGGDTSSHGARALGLLALTAEATLAPGAPLLAGHRAAGPPIELVLKGGQMGADDFFIRIRDGAPPPTRGKDQT